MALLMRDSTPYFLNSDLSIVLPSANQSNISSVRHNLGIPLEHASRYKVDVVIGGQGQLDLWFLYLRITNDIVILVTPLCF